MQFFSLHLKQYHFFGYISNPEKFKIDTCNNVKKDKLRNRGMKAFRSFKCNWNWNFILFSLLGRQACTFWSALVLSRFEYITIIQFRINFQNQSPHIKTKKELEVLDPYPANFFLNERSWIWGYFLEHGRRTFCTIFRA